MSKIPYTFNNDSLTAFVNGRPYTINADHKFFDDLKNCILNNDAVNFLKLYDVKKIVAKVTMGNVWISEDDNVYYKNLNVPDYLATRILEHYENGVIINPIIKFAEKLMQNPNEEVRNDLYKWLEIGKMPIYEDGDFMAFKVVKSDFTPIRSGPYGKDQSPGTIVTQPRHTCNESRDVTCASGLHFCSWDYLPHFNGFNSQNTIIEVRINPKDVVAIPTDYNLTKGRCCEFFVVSEIDRDIIKQEFGDKLVIIDDVDDALWDECSFEEDGDPIDHDHENEVKIKDQSNIPYTINGLDRTAYWRIEVPTSVKNYKDITNALKEVIDTIKPLSMIASEYNTSTRTLGRWFAKYARY